MESLTKRCNWCFKHAKLKNHWQSYLGCAISECNALRIPISSGPQSPQLVQTWMYEGGNFPFLSAVVAKHLSWWHVLFFFSPRTSRASCSYILLKPEAPCFLTLVVYYTVKWSKYQISKHQTIKVKTSMTSTPVLRFGKALWYIGRVDSKYILWLPCSIQTTHMSEYIVYEQVWQVWCIIMFQLGILGCFMFDEVDDTSVFQKHNHSTPQLSDY